MNKPLSINNKVFKMNNQLLGIKSSGFVFSHLVENDNDVVGFRTPAGTHDIIVDWGDNSIQEYSGSGDHLITHEYQNSGSYDIEIKGSVERLFLDWENNLKITDVKDWGNRRGFDGFFVLRFLNQELLVDFSAKNTPFIHPQSTMAGLFEGCSNFNGNINHWNTKNIKRIERAFRGCHSFNQPLNNWDVSNVENMNQMFMDCLIFNQPLFDWNTGKVSNMSQMFRNAQVFNQNINDWDVSNVENFNECFLWCYNFNQPLNNWDVSNVKLFNQMFRESSFNQPLNNWDVGNAENMTGMFRQTPFNQNINNWDVSNVKNISLMFFTTIFNQPLNNWDVSNVENMDGTFRTATFNQPLNNWDVSAVSNMNNMFRLNTTFNQDLSRWCVSQFQSEPSMFSEGATGWTEPKPVWGTCPTEIYIHSYEQPIEYKTYTDNEITINLNNIGTTGLFYLVITGSSQTITTEKEYIETGSFGQIEVKNLNFTTSGQTILNIRLYNNNDQLMDEDNLTINVVELEGDLYFISGTQQSGDWYRNQNFNYYVVVGNNGGTDQCYITISTESDGGSGYSYTSPLTTINGKSTHQFSYNGSFSTTGNKSLTIKIFDGDNQLIEEKFLNNTINIKTHPITLFMGNENFISGDNVFTFSVDLTNGSMDLTANSARVRWNINIWEHHLDRFNWGNFMEQDTSSVSIQPLDTGSVSGTFHYSMKPEYNAALAELVLTPVNGHWSGGTTFTPKYYYISLLRVAP